MINRILHKFNLRLVRYFPREATKFAQMYFHSTPITVVEIGTLGGEHAKSLLKELYIQKIYLVDPYKEYGEYTRVSDYKEIAKGRLKDYEDKIVWIEKESNDAVKEIKEKVDLVYIDGDHTEPQVIKDLENYYAILKDGGVLAGHNITSHKDVCSGLMDFCSKRNYKPHIMEQDFFLIKGIKDTKEVTK